MPDSTQESLKALQTQIRPHDLVLAQGRAGTLSKTGSAPSHLLRWGCPMGFSYHLKFPRRTLKIKTRSHMRTSELYGDVPTLKFGSIYLVWTPSSTLALESNNKKTLNQAGTSEPN